VITPTATLHDSPFVAYAYSYPHKTAYRRFEQPIALQQLWQTERRDALFLYLHIPFCEYRCGFCNLFTQSNPASGMPARYLQQLRHEAQRVRAALGDAQFVRLAVGGGTPTFLSCDELIELWEIVTQVMGAQPSRIPVSMEASPATVDAEKLALLREFGVDRLSLGVQTFDDAESRRLGRPQRHREAHTALEAVRNAGFPILNIDLIYGGEGQSVASWLDSVQTALTYRPEELYLYPLYVRDQTGLGRRGGDWDDHRLDAYREARQVLLSAGYEQVSFRMFRAAHSPAEAGPVYCCQSDGMIGLGCGARSYATALHYSTEYAVGHGGVRAILADYLSRDAGSFDAAHYGILLDEEDRRRRFVILSLLQCEGLSRPDYAAKFGGDVLDDLPQLAELDALHWATVEADRIRLTAAGLERSDAIGPWLYSAKVQTLMESFAWR
jgi:oxygen-independent coproporphyrinogen III oxidase